MTDATFRPGGTSLLDVLKERFGFDDFLPLQEEIIGHVLAGRDALVLMPTGGGKSLCYQLPALVFDGLTLVVSPLIALMKDQVDALQANGIPAAFVNSTLTAEQIGRVQTLALGRRLKILYAAPERLARSGFRDFLRALEVNLVAIDEAHCISEWGHDFRPDYRNLNLLRRDFHDVPFIALTATATTRVRRDIVGQLDLREPRTFLASFNRPNLTYHVRPKRRAFESLIDLLKSRRGEPAIVYCFSRKQTEELAGDLAGQGLSALPYHAGLDGDLRRRTQDRFIRDEVPIVVATIAFGMGIDKPDVRIVVHYDMPKTLEGYYQETGRAGRDGLPSECVLFYSYGDKYKHDFFIDQIEDEAERERAQLKLKQMIDFCESRECRRRQVLRYFGEEWEGDGCGACDVCLASAEQFDATEVTHKVLSAVIRTEQRFGMNHVIDVLRGSRSQRVISARHDRLSVHGIVRDLSADDLRDIVRQLVTRGLLAREGDDYPTLAVTAAGRELLRRRESVTLSRPPRETAASEAPSELPYDRPLFEKLRALRREIAGTRGVPPWVVFGDRALQQMAYYYPQSRNSFGRVSGVGAAKLAEFGEAFMRVIRDHAATDGHVEREMPTPHRDEQRRVRKAGPSDRETGRLLAERLSVSEIARRRGLAETTIMGHLDRLAAAGEHVELAHLLPSPDRRAKIEAAFREVGFELLSPVRELLGDEYSYQELRVVRLDLPQQRS